MLLEETGQRQSATAMRLNRELNRNAERFDQTIKTVDKVQSRNLNEFREQTISGIAMAERHFEELINNVKLTLSEQATLINTKANDTEIRIWVEEQISEKAKELMAYTDEKVSTLEAKVDKQHDETAKYLKLKFDKMQDKHFTVPGLVGEGPRYPYSYLGEYLAEAHSENKRRYTELDSLSKKTAESLQKLEEFTTFSINEQVPHQFLEQ